MIHAFKDLKSSQRVEADVVVVGTGAGGAVAAHRLRKAGKSVVLIEEGSYVQPSEFSPDFQVAMRQIYRDKGMRAMVGSMIIPTMQARCVGGTTVINSAICFRLPDDILEQWVTREKLKGLSPETLRPLFEEVEKMTNIKPEPKEVVGRHNLLMKKGCEVLGWEHGPILRNSKGCKGCGVCMNGCPEGAKMSMDRTYVPAFVEMGGELYTDCRVEKILVTNNRAEGVVGVFIDPKSLKPAPLALEVRAKAVVISCGAMGTPVLLQKNNLANSSSLVGRNLCNHTATGMLGFFDEEVCSWNGTNQGWCCDHFRKQGFMLEVWWAGPGEIGIRVPGFGMRHKDMMGRLRHVAGFGVMIRATTTGRVIASRSSWTPTILYFMNQHDAKVMQKGMKATADVFFAAGAKLVAPGINKVPMELGHPRQSETIMAANLKPTDFNPIGNHPSGTCRMSEVPGKGVVNSFGETHDVKRLFIADASIFPNSPGVNPQETIMALAAHIANHISQAI